MNKKLEKLYRYCKANGYDESFETFESDLNKLLIQQIEGDELSMIAGGRNVPKTLAATLISALSIASPFASANQNGTSRNVSTKNAFSVSSEKNISSNKKSQTDILKNILLKGVLPVAGIGTIGIGIEELIRRKPWEKKDKGRAEKKTREQEVEETEKLRRAQEERRKAEEAEEAEKQKLRAEKYANLSPAQCAAQLMFTECRGSKIDKEQVARCCCNEVKARDLAIACVERVCKKNHNDIRSATRKLYDAIEKDKNSGDTWERALYRAKPQEYSNYSDQIEDYGNTFIEELKTKTDEILNGLLLNEYLVKCFGSTPSMKVLSDNQISSVQEIIRQIVDTLGLGSFDNLKQYICSDMTIEHYLEYESKINGYIYGYLCQSLQGYLFGSNDNKYSLHPDNNGIYLSAEDYLDRLALSYAFARSGRGHNIDEQKLSKVWNCMKILNEHLKDFCDKRKDCPIFTDDNVLNGLQTIAIDNDGSFDFKDVSDPENNKVIGFLRFAGCLYSNLQSRGEKALSRSRIRCRDGNEYTLKSFCEMFLKNSISERTCHISEVIILGDEDGTNIQFSYSSVNDDDVEMRLDEFTITRKQREKITNALGSFEFYYGIDEEKFNNINTLINYATTNDLLNQSISLDDVKTMYNKKFIANSYKDCLYALLMKIWRTKFGHDASVNWIIAGFSVPSPIDRFLAGVLLSGKFKNNEKMFGFIKTIVDCKFKSELLEKYESLIERIDGDYSLDDNTQWIVSNSDILLKTRFSSKPNVNTGKHVIMRVGCDTIIEELQTLGVIK